MTRTQSAELIRCDPVKSPRLMPDILYVMGTGRSGTTILDVMLSNNPGITGGGEMTHIFKHGFLENRQCSCGKKALECEVWGKVLVTTGWSRADCTRLAKLVTTLEAHSKFSSLWMGITNKRDIERYQAAHRALFQAVVAFTGAEVVVDSSKYESRALLFTRLFPAQVKVVCITRSAAGLIAAFRKKNDDEEQVSSKSLFAVTAYYGYVLLCMRVLRARLGTGCLVIRFEDLQRDPAAVLSRIEAWSGYQLTNAKEKLKNGGHFTISHIVSGNRLRKRRTVKFEPGLGEPVFRGAVGILAAAMEAYRRWLGF